MKSVLENFYPGLKMSMNEIIMRVSFVNALEQGQLIKDYLVVFI